MSEQNAGKMLEQDSRFPSGPWQGYFLQPALFPGKSWMDLDLTFSKGMLRGTGRDRVGEFLFRGRYDVKSGKCWWTKRYLGMHDIQYDGYNEGRGVWGVWTDPRNPASRGGFHIWPLAMGDPTQKRLAAEADVPTDPKVEHEEMVEAAS